MVCQHIGPLLILSESRVVNYWHVVDPHQLLRVITVNSVKIALVLIFAFLAFSLGRKIKIRIN